MAAPLLRDLEHISQSGPDSGLGWSPFSMNVLKTIEVFPSSLGSNVAAPRSGNTPRKPQHRRISKLQPRDSKLEAPNPRPHNGNPKLEAANSKSQTRNPKFEPLNLNLPNLKLQTRNSKLDVQRSMFRTRNSDLETPYPKP